MSDLGSGKSDLGSGLLAREGGENEDRSVAGDVEVGGLAARPIAQQAHQVAHGVDDLAREAEQQIAGAKTRGLSGASPIDAQDLDSGALLDIEGVAITRR